MQSSLRVLCFFCLTTLFLTGCVPADVPPPAVIPSTAASPAITPLLTFTPSPSFTLISQPTTTPVPTATPTPLPSLVRSIDLAAFAAEQGGKWFSADLESFSDAHLKPGASYTVQGTPAANRNDGQIAPALAARYVFLQFGNVTPQMIEQNANSIRALFIRSALMSFVDYAGNTVLDWDRRSAPITMDIEGMISTANRLAIPVYLELNYSDYIPGPRGSGVGELVPADNIARSIDYLQKLQAAGIHVDGVTFGDEIGDQSGFGEKKPTNLTEDMAGRFVRYASALKKAFPELKIYAFDSCISAARGELSQSLDLLTRVRQGEEETGQVLLDGFVFRESYVYMDENGTLLNSQSILDDTESLYRNANVYRFETMGRSFKPVDKDYLHTLLEFTRQVFGRDIEIGLTEYLPAGPTQIDESDTSIYADIDFILHYADVMGIYASLGLDFVSTWVFANEVDKAKCYLDIHGGKAASYPVHAQIAENFQGQLLQVNRDPDVPGSRIKVYAARDGDRAFIMILNKIVGSPQVIRLFIPGELDLTLKLPGRSYTSLVIEDNRIILSGIGN